MPGKKWVLLVAGSKGWDNYQHQANVCALYQIIKTHGIPDEQIVVMMYDDIAYNAKNPLNYKGKIVSVINQENVYTGVPKDYTQREVTPENFLAALQGDGSAGGKKVIKSGSGDEIFVYMSGLGDSGIFYFLEEELSTSRLIEAINNMSTDKKFSKMVIYMDSDKSGSMFVNHSNLKNVYAVTSCDENNKNIPSDSNQTLKVNLSDQFSSALLKFIYENDFSSATLKDMFDMISKNVKFPSCQFGDTKINECLLSEFL